MTKKTKKINYETAEIGTISGWHDVPEKEYHARSEISKHGLDNVNRSPLHYKSDTTTTTPAMALGSAVHAYVLEPETFADNYIVIPEGITTRQKAYKEIEAETAGKGMAVISFENMQKVKLMRAGLIASSSAARLLELATSETAMIEKSGFAELCGVSVRCRVDIALPDLGILVDLKTTADARASEFSRSVVNYRYHVQAAMYLDIANAIAGETLYKEFAFLCVEKTAPFGTRVYKLDERAIEFGRELYIKDLAVYSDCLKTGSWPCYDTAIAVLDLPAWAYYDRSTEKELS